MGPGVTRPGEGPNLGISLDFALARDVFHYEQLGEASIGAIWMGHSVSLNHSMKAFLPLKFSFSLRKLKKKPWRFSSLK